MIKKIEITGMHTKVDADLEKYITRKISKLDKYMHRHVRESVHAGVKLKESRAKDKKECTCEVILFLPSEQVLAKETTLNMYAAVDIVEAKLKNQLKKYKDKHGGGKKVHSNSRFRRALARLRRSEPSSEVTI